MAENFWVFHNGIFSRLVFILPKQTKVLFSCSYYFLRGVYHNCKKQTSALKVNVNFLCIVIIHSEIFSRANKNIYRESLRFTGKIAFSISLLSVEVEQFPGVCFEYENCISRKNQKRNQLSVGTGYSVFLQANWPSVKLLLWKFQCKNVIACGIIMMAPYMWSFSRVLWIYPWD